MDAPANTEQIVAVFFAAASTGQVEPLLELLAPDVVLHSDGGGKKQAALNPIRGADKVARFLAAVVPQDAVVDVRMGVVNGSPSLFVYLDGELDSIGTVTTENSLVKEIFLVRNPDKLADVAEREIRSR